MERFKGVACISSNLGAFKTRDRAQKIQGFKLDVIEVKLANFNK